MCARRVQEESNIADAPVFRRVSVPDRSKLQLVVRADERPMGQVTVLLGKQPKPVNVANSVWLPFYGRHIPSWKLKGKLAALDPAASAGTVGVAVRLGWGTSQRISLVASGASHPVSGASIWARGPRRTSRPTVNARAHRP